MRKKVSAAAALTMLVGVGLLAGEPALKLGKKVTTKPQFTEEEKTYLNSLSKKDKKQAVKDLMDKYYTRKT